MLLLSTFALLVVFLTALTIRLRGVSSLEELFSSDAPSESSPSSPSSSMFSRSSSEPEPEPEPEPLPTLVPQGEEVPPVYFQDVVFVGDSLTEGLRLYGTPELLPPQNVVAYTGINPNTIGYAAVLTNSQGQPCTFLEKLVEMQPDCIYYMNGTNGVGWMSNSELVELNRAFLSQVKEALPDCEIYVQSIFPFTASLCARDPLYSNDLVREYNQLLYEMAQDMGFYFINSYEAFADEKGNLPEEASVEGIHFGPTYYGKWAAYLACHTLLEEEEREALEQRQRLWEEGHGNSSSQERPSESAPSRQPQPPDQQEEPDQPPESNQSSESSSEEPPPKRRGSL